MTLNQYQNAAARTIRKDLPKTDISLHALFGLSAEVGELMDIYQKWLQGHIGTNEFIQEHKKKELGDILWMVAEYATANGWTLDEVATTNLDKLRARYPEGFDPDKSMHRKAGDI